MARSITPPLPASSRESHDGARGEGGSRATPPGRGSGRASDCSAVCVGQCGEDDCILADSAGELTGICGATGDVLILARPDGCVGGIITFGWRAPLWPRSRLSLHDDPGGSLATAGAPSRGYRSRLLGRSGTRTPAVEATALSSASG